MAFDDEGDPSFYITQKIITFKNQNKVLVFMLCNH